MRRSGLHGYIRPRFWWPYAVAAGMTAYAGVLFWRVLADVAATGRFLASL